LKRWAEPGNVTGVRAVQEICINFAIHLKNKGLKILLRNFCALLLLLVFLTGTMPRDFLHQEFAHHQDTVDTFHHDAQVSKKHVHCDFLHILLAQYVSAAPCRLERTPEGFTNRNCFFFATVHDTCFSCTYLRGPPRC
jgi:hypothetical protein